MLQQPRITIGASEVIASGAVLSRGWNSVDLYPIASSTWKTRLSFQGKPGQIPQLSVSYPEGFCLVSLINFDYPALTSHPDPLYVSNYASRRMYLHLACMVIGTGESATRNTQFTFYYGEAMNG